MRVARIIDCLPPSIACHRNRSTTLKRAEAHQFEVELNHEVNEWNYS
jgi:hypothetical protein